MISVLLPTRGRPDLLTRSIDSLRARADADPEIICWVDDDDPDTRIAADALADTRICAERIGYTRMHHMVNVLAAAAHGQWLLLWNDDAVMRTDGWDRHVECCPTDLVLNPATNHGPGLAPFPIVPARFVETLGHFSLNAHCDSWWQEIGTRLGVLVDIPVEVFHDRHDLTGANDDATFRERRYDPEFYGAANLALIDADVRVLTEARAA